MTNAMVYLLPIVTVLVCIPIAFLIKPKGQKNLKLLLAFSGSFLLALTFFELLPEVYLDGYSKQIAVFILLGILLQIFLEFFSKGAEHGHMHINIAETHFPWLLFLSLSLHSLVEGFPLHGENSIIYGVLLHKLPVALILGIFLANSNLGKLKTVLFMVLFALMTPLGSYLSQNAPFFIDYSTELKALAVGIFLHVATTILFESSQGHAFNLRKLFVIVLGIGLAYFL